ncbi:hypothetical protein [Acidovorax sp. FG27]|uniref:hypothetical protein n=1 Tax=Acidovorax sp. FG27 TaxID=3133652 RepID=UPI00333FD28B
MDAAIFGNTNFVYTLHKKIFTGLSTVASVKPPRGLAANEKVCTFAYTSGWRCGTMTFLDWEYFVGPHKTNLARATFCGAPGDSGGPVVNEGKPALGIYVGTTASTNSTTCGAVFGDQADSVFQPIMPYLARYPNVTIMSE